MAVDTKNILSVAQNVWQSLALFLFMQLIDYFLYVMTNNAIESHLQEPP